MADAKKIFPIINAATLEMGLTSFIAALFYSQGLQESGFNSPVFVKNTNPFGMKMPRKRKSPYIAGKGTAAPASESFAGDPFNYYARYTSISNAVKDLIHRHNEFGIKWDDIKTPEDYVAFCKKTKYFQGSPAIYKSNVTSLFKMFGKAVTNNPGLASITGAIAIATVFFF